MDFGGVVGSIAEGSSLEGGPLVEGPESLLPWGVGAAATSVRSRRTIMDRMMKVKWQLKDHCLRL
jgi:hypothetical protein